jgi:TonB family protein
VAYDRDEQISKAQAMAQAAIAADRNMNELKSPSVFFIPEGDIHYYFAMGYLVQGKTEEAKKEWQLFLKDLPDSQWAPRARAHLAELGVAEKRPPRARKRLAPVPKRRTGKEETLARDRYSIRGRLQGYLYKLRRCYQRELRRDKSLTGELKLGFTVGKTGRVLNARVLRSTLGKPALHSCVLRAIREIRFSRTASGQAVKMTYPLRFKP